MKKPTIDTLVKDIYKLFDPSYQHDFDPTNIEAFGQRVARHVANRISETRGKNHLRMSSLGQPDRKLWLSINKQELGEPIDAVTYVKFLYGDILEELLLFLAKEAGHEVTGEQDTVEINGVVGHRDAVIDGVLTDVKSASTFSFSKFKNHTLDEDDLFGYIDQINQYLYASENDDLVREKDVAVFFAIDKQHGHMCIDKYPKNGKDYSKVVDEKRAMLDGDMPELCYEPLEEGKSGNLKLGVGCSYCPFKKVCYPNLRTFLYKQGANTRPVFLTKVIREPKVFEVIDD